MPSHGRVRKRWNPDEVDGSLTATMPDPPDRPPWTELFGRDAPLFVEVGFGKGDFIRALAEEHPEANIVGIEIKQHLVYWVESKLLLTPIRNVRLIIANARWQLGRLFAPASLDGVYINFPDPWPKARHVKRRLFHPGLADTLVRLVKPGGLVHCVTDVEDYGAVARQSLTEHQAFENGAVSSDWTERLPGYPETIHERKFRAGGRTIHFMCYRKVSQ